MYNQSRSGKIRNICPVDSQGTSVKGWFKFNKEFCPVSPDQHRAQFIVICIAETVCFCRLAGPVYRSKSSFTMHKTERSQPHHHKMTFTGLLIRYLLFKC